MEGASRAFGAAGEITLAGRKLRLRGRLGDYFGEVEAEMLRQRPDPWRALEENAPRFKDQPDALKCVSEATVALANRTKDVGRDEFWHWLGTWRGGAYLLWLAVRHEEPELDRDAVLKLMVEEEERRLAEIVLGEGQTAEASKEEVRDGIVRDINEKYAAALGTDPSGNSTGPPTEVEAGQQRESQESSPGDES